MAKITVDRQAEKMGEVVGDLIRAYQFRDKNDICCHGVSVSQCYTLDALHRHGPMTMGQIGEHLYLDVSTVTRVVDQLCDAGHVERVTDPDDRRVVRATITPMGLEVVAGVRATLQDEYREVLCSIPEDARQAVIDAMELLLEAFTSRGCCARRRQSARSAEPAA